MEVRSDGTTRTYAGPVVVSDDGIHPLAAAIVNVQSVRAAPSVAAAIQGAAERHHLSTDLVEAVAWQESRLHQNAVSPKGARGVMQLMPSTAKSVGVDANSLDGNVNGGATYLAQMMIRFDGDLIKSLAAYNAGPAAVARYGGVPPWRETRNYVDAILDRLSSTPSNANSEVAR
jgi:soluble lytic murein transglycosylase-like protein